MNNDPKDIPPPGFVAKIPPVGKVFTDPANPPGPGWLWSDEADPPRWLPPDASSPHFHQAIEDAHQSSPSPPPQGASAPDPQGQDRGQGEEEPASVEDNALPCPTCGNVPDTHRKRQVRHLHVKCEGMIGFISELQGILNVKGGFKRMLDEVKSLKGMNMPASQQPATTTQSTVEWVRNAFVSVSPDPNADPVLRHDDALELARRCDEAEADSFTLAKGLSNTSAQLADIRAKLAAPPTPETELKSCAEMSCEQCNEQRDNLRAQLAAAQAEARELREVLGWYAGELRFCNAMSREGDESRNRLAKDHGNRAVEVLAKHKEAQP